MKQHKEAFIKKTYALGYRTEFDFGEVKLKINAELKKFIGKNEKELSDELVKLALFYGFTPVVKNSFSGNEKGHVEQSVKHVRNKAFTKVYTFNSLISAQHHDFVVYFIDSSPLQHRFSKEYIRFITVDCYFFKIFNRNIHWNCKNLLFII